MSLHDLLDDAAGQVVAGRVIDPAAVLSRAGQRHQAVIRRRALASLTAVAATVALVMLAGAPLLQTIRADQAPVPAAGERSEGGEPVLPELVLEPSAAPELAFSQTGQRGTARVSVVVQGEIAGQTGVYALDADTGALVSLVGLPGDDPDSPLAREDTALAVSPNGRFVVVAPADLTVTPGAGAGARVVDLLSAQVRRLELPTPPGRRNSLAVLDDGTLAIVRSGVHGLWIYQPGGKRRELTRLGEVMGVSPGGEGRFLAWRYFVDDASVRADVLDSYTGEVLGAASGLSIAEGEDVQMGLANDDTVLILDGGGMAWRRSLDVKPGGTSTAPLGDQQRPTGAITAPDDGQWLDAAGDTALLDRGGLQVYRVADRDGAAELAKVTDLRLPVQYAQVAGAVIDESRLLPAPSVDRWLAATTSPQWVWAGWSVVALLAVLLTLTLVSRAHSRSYRGFSLA